MSNVICLNNVSKLFLCCAGGSCVTHNPRLQDLILILVYFKIVPAYPVSSHLLKRIPVLDDDCSQIRGDRSDIRFSKVKDIVKISMGLTGLYQRLMAFRLKDLNAD